MKTNLFCILVALCALVLFAGIVLACIFGQIVGVWMVAGSFLAMLGMMGLNID